MKIERTKDMPQIKKALFAMVTKDTANIPNDDIWRNYERSFTYDGKNYNVSLVFKKNDKYFSYRNLEIAHEQEVKELWQPSNLM